MRNLRNLACAVVLLALALPAVAQEDPQMSEAAMAEVQAWMELMQPGEHHEHLGRMVGKWTSEVKMWMEAGTEPMVEGAEAEAAFILGGRYLEWRVTGVFGGMPFEARQIDAYNNGDKRYETTWIDNFGTLVLVFTGQCENDGAVRTLHTEYTDPTSGETLANRVVYTWQDDDHLLYESFLATPEGEFQNMEITYTRVE